MGVIRNLYLGFFMVVFLGYSFQLAQGQSKIVKTQTSFSCEGRPSGYYADVETGCQIYHMCDGLGRQFSYSCPNTTLFQQRMLICDHWYMVNCSKSELDYDANLLIGQRDKLFVDESEHVYHRTPRPDLLTIPYAPTSYADRQAKVQNTGSSGTNSVGPTKSTSNRGGNNEQQTYNLPIHWSTEYSTISTTETPRTTKSFRPPVQNVNHSPTKTSDKQNIPKSVVKSTIPPTYSTQSRNEYFTTNIFTQFRSTVPTTTQATASRRIFEFLTTNNSPINNNDISAPSVDLLPPFLEYKKYELSASNEDYKDINFDYFKTGTIPTRITETITPASTNFRTNDYRTSQQTTGFSTNFETLRFTKSTPTSLETASTETTIRSTVPQLIRNPIKNNIPLTPPSISQQFPVPAMQEFTTKQPLENVPKPSQDLVPPKLTAQNATYYDTSTSDPLTLYNLVPSKDLQPPKGINIDRADVHTDVIASKSMRSKKVEAKALLDEKWKDLRKMFFIPEYDFPLESINRPGYDSYSSYLVNPAGDVLKSKNNETLKIEVNLECPNCDPSLLEPGTCHPCVLIKR